MISMERKRPGHVKLPSFTELTSTFSTTLKINNPNDEQLLQPPALITASVPPGQRSGPGNQPHYHHQHVSHSYPVTPTSASHIQSPTHFNYPPSAPAPPPQHPQHPQHQQQHHEPPQHPQHQQPQTLQQPVSGRPASRPAPVPVPTGMPNYTFPPHPKQTHADPNFVTSTNFPPPPAGPPLHLQQQQHQQPQFPPGRRHSLQIPPHHVKNDSVDSQASLQTLASIASYNPPGNNGLKGLLSEFEHGFIGFDELYRNLSDIKTDFMDHLKLSATSQDHQHSLKPLSLDFDYNFNELGTLDEYHVEYFEKLLNNIPAQTITDSINITNDLALLFQHILIQKEQIQQGRFSFKGESSRSRKREAVSPLQPPPPPAAVSTSSSSASVIQTGGSAPVSAPSAVSVTSNPASISTPVSAPVPTTPQHSQSIRRHGSMHSRRLSVPSASITKKRKPSRAQNIIKPENVSLVVNPPKPQTEPKDSQSLKGDFLEDLSVKQDHKCVQCGSSDTPEWRRGPYGSRSLCNACGLFYGKLVKRFGDSEASLIMRKRKDSGHGDDRRIPTDLN